VSSLLGELGGIAGNAAGETVAFAAGRAGSETLSPIAEAVSQKAWSVAPIKLPAAQFLALGVAQGQVDPDEAKGWALKQGFGDAQWAAMVNIANVGPALGAAYQAWRRGLLTDDEFTTALNRTGLEPQWYAALKGLKEELLDPAEIAKAIHRGIIPGEGLLITEPPSTPGKVPMVPPSSIDALTEAAGSGIDSERLRVMVGNAGLPPGIVQMLQLLNRDVITEDDFQRGVGESNLRNEWGPAIVALRRHVLTAHEYAELRVRGWIDDQAMYAGTALSGMTEDDTKLLFELLGRPIALHQVTKGLARGGSYGGDYAGVPEPFRTALEQSNVRPEWGNLDFAANQYTWPSFFVLKPLTASGVLTVDETTSILEWSGWEPSLAAKTAASFVGSSSSAKLPTEAQLAQQYEAGQIDRPTYVKDLEARGYSADNAEKVAAATDAKPLISARTSVLSKLRNGVVGGSISAAQATAELEKTTVSPATIPTLVAAWEHEYAIEHPSTAPAG